MSSRSRAVSLSRAASSSSSASVYRRSSSCWASRRWSCRSPSSRSFSCSRARRRADSPTPWAEISLMAASCSSSRASSLSSSGMRPTLRFTRRRLRISRRRCSVWAKDTSSRPPVTRAAIRFSNSGAAVTAREPPWPMKAERSYTSRPTPVSSWPQLAAVRPGTASPEAVYTAEKAPKGTLPRGPRRMVTSRPCHSRRSSPSMGAPDQG